MTPIAIEAWVLRVADQVAGGAHSEDSRVELKAEWPKATNAARLIAAHANAARGTPILWIIGLDETDGPVGAAPEELANWFSTVRSCFEGVVPSLFDLNVNVGGKTVVALVFQTDRAPFVVKNPAFGAANGGPVELEIPWREGRKTRTARREDLVRLLAPLVQLPEIEWLDCQVSARLEPRAEGGKVDAWYLHGSYYISPSGANAVVIPFHRSSLRVVSVKSGELGPWEQLRMLPPYRYGGGAGKIVSKVDSMTVAASSTEVVVTGPGKINFQASGKFPIDEGVFADPLEVSVQFRVIGASVPISTVLTLLPGSPDTSQRAVWALGNDAT